MRQVAVVDLGKTNSKVTLVDSESQKEIKVIRQPASLIEDDIYPCIDVQAIDKFVRESLFALNQYSEIDALTVTTHGATVALLDQHGQLSLPVMDYEFEGVDELGPEYDAIRPDFQQTGSPRLPGGLNVGAQLYWQQAQFKDRFKQTRFILTWPQYWVYRFCGALHNDVSSLGAHSDLYCPGMKSYSSLVDNQGWNNLMPPMEQSGYACGHLGADWLQSMEREKPIAVYTGIHDSNASLVPHLKAHAAPFSVVSTGTWFIAMAVGGDKVALDENRDTLLNVNAFGDPVPSARFMGGRERELLRKNLPTGVNRDAGIQTLVSGTDENHVFLMPSMVKGTGPYPNKESLWTNEAADVNVQDCLITLYLSMMTAQCLNLIGAAGAIYVEGPLATDRLFNQMLSVAADRPVLISEGETGTSVGAAMLIADMPLVQQYQSVSVERTMREFLQSYAKSWRAALELYVS